MRASITRLAARVGLLVGSLVVALLLAEALLQVGAWVVRATGREAPDGFESDAVRVLCLGDSNTYGLYLQSEEAYPQQLESLWATHRRKPEIEVVNLGYPGTNSSVVLREYARALRTFAPDVVIVMVGVNDFWTVAVERVSEAGWLSRVGAAIRRHSRVLKFVSILWPEPAPAPRTADGVPGRPVLEIEHGNEVFSLGWEGEKRPVPEDSDRLRDNLRELVRASRAHGTTLVLMTYPSKQNGLYRRANRLIRAVAQQTDTPLADLTPIFGNLCPDPDCQTLLFPDFHPRAPGYAVIAETLAERLPGWIER